MAGSPVATRRTRQQDHAQAQQPRRSITFVSVVLPCLNEEEGVGPTVREAFAGLAAVGVDGEVLVVDNGSTDRSVERAKAAGAEVIREERRGYGAAHLAGIRAARGDVIVMADADGTYELGGLGRLLAPFEHGASMVVGSRLLGELHPNAMPTLHRYIGTPAITRMLRAITGVRISDSQSGYRAFWRDEALRLGLRAPGMEYASEMLLRAGRAGWRIVDVPSAYRPRIGESKLSTLSDGWRHLKMLLVMSPHVSLILPGLLFALVGLGVSLLILLEPAGIAIGSMHWVPVFLGPMLLILGAQAFLLGALASARSDVIPARFLRSTAFVRGPGAVNRLLRNCALLVVGGLLVDSGLFVVWLADFSDRSVIGIAGLAQAAIVIGAMGIAAVLAAELSREDLWS